MTISRKEVTEAVRRLAATPGIKPSAEKVKISSLEAVLDESGIIIAKSSTPHTLLNSGSAIILRAVVLLLYL